MNRAYLIGYVLNGMNSLAACPLCGYSNYRLKALEPHFDEYHSLPGDVWTLQTVVHPENQLHRFYIMSDTPLTNADQEYRDKRKKEKDKKEKEK